MKFVVYIICCSCFILSCTKKLIGDKIMAFSYKQTQCADPWINNSNDSITMHNVSHFLDSVNIAGPEFGISIQNDGVAEICSACTCKTGKTIYVSNLYDEILLSKYQALGFVRIQ